MKTTQRTRLVADQRRLIHLLNQRYHQEFIRAERLEADLRVVQKLRATWVLRGLRWLRNLLRRQRPAPADCAVAPLPLRPVSLDGRVSVIIPFRDRGELLRDCLASLRHSSPRPHEIVLVDNGSRERSLLRLLRKLERQPGYRVVRDPSPFNFSRLCNAGAAAATGDWLVFLNNDTSVLTENWLDELIRVARQPNVGIVGATLFYPDGTLQHAGLTRRADGVWEHPGRGQRVVSSEVQTVPAVSAACLLIGRALFEQLHGFDEARPVTHNDVELCRRARALGHLVAVTPHARLLHYESLSRGYTLTPPDVEPVKQASTELLGMTSSEERRYCFDYMSRHYTGRGAAVELGCWLGACTAELARGLLRNRRRTRDWRIEVYDRFRWQPAMNFYVKGTPFEGRFAARQWFLSGFLKQVTPWLGQLKLHVGDLARTQWDGRPIEFLLVDALKDQAVTRNVVRQFFPALLPGALVLEQDYSHFWTSWIHILHYKLREHFELATDLTESCGVVFRVTRPLSAEQFEGEDWLSCVDPREVRRAFTWSRRQVAPHKRGQIAAAEVLHWHHAGQPDRVDETLQRHRVAGLLGDNELRCIEGCLAR